MTLQSSIAASMVLLAVYWFRYACMMMVRQAEEERRSAASLAERNRLSFPSFADPASWASADTADVCQLLDRDYRYLVYLAQADRYGIPTLDRWLVAVDYRLMAACLRLGRTPHSPMARYALREMLGLLLYLSSIIDRSSRLDTIHRGIGRLPSTTARASM